MGYPEEQELDPNWVCCLLEDIPDTCCDAFPLDSAIPWPSQTEHPFVSPTFLSKNSKDSCGTSDGQDDCCRKRVRGMSSSATSSRACREKLRRDRVNERLLELSAVLEPGKTPKLDKAATLTDAAQMVKLLQQESTNLKSRNVELTQKINEFKAEKKELRSEKNRLKAEKDQIEQRIKALGVPHHGMHTRPSVDKSLYGAYAITTQPAASKMMPVFNYPGVPMWHFVPHTSVDASQDHAFHPPVA